MVAATGFTDRRVKAVAGDITDNATLQTLLDDSVDIVIHLAAVVSSQEEENFALGLETNLLASLGLIERLRQLGTCTVFHHQFGRDFWQQIA